MPASAPKKRKQGNHSRLAEEKRLSEQQLAALKKRKESAPLHAEIRTYYRAKLAIYQAEVDAGRLVLNGAAFRWSLPVWEDFWERMTHKAGVSVEANNGCWHGSSAGVYNKARINNADEYIHALAWAFDHLDDAELIQRYVSNAGRNRGNGHSAEIAHRCHNAECFKPECLVIADPATNTDMDGCRYGTLATCPHESKPPYVKCIFRKPINIGATFGK